MVVTMTVPHNKNAVNSFTVYPWPVQPPALHKYQAKLPVTAKNIKPMLIQSGFDKREVSNDKPYPLGGWRWQDAYRRALKRSGFMQPIFLPQIYLWADSMIPYVKAECEKSNKIEEDRQEAYKAANADYAQNRQDVETEAGRKRLHPIELKLTGLKNGVFRQGQVGLKAGSWWIIGTHKVPGLVYYWQLPIVVKEGESNKFDLNEINALLIEGGW